MLLHWVIIIFRVTERIHDNVIRAKVKEVSAQVYAHREPGKVSLFFTGLH